MKPISARFVAVAVAAALFAGCSSSGASTAPSVAATNGPTTAPTAAPSAAPASSAATMAAPTSLIKAGTITDCVDIEYPPLEYFPSSNITDPNQAIGWDVDAAKAVVAKLGLKIDIRNTGFDALIPDLQAGRCDIVWTGLYVSAKRLAVADAVPYMATGQVVMVPAGNAKAIKSAMDLCGKKVSIQSGGLVEQRINQASKDCTAAGKPAISIQGYPKVADELQQIILGRVDAVWETDSAVSDFQNRNPGKYEVAYALPKDDSYGAYYQKGKKDIGDALTAALRALKADGTLATIAKTYSIDPITLDVIK